MCQFSFIYFLQTIRSQSNLSVVSPPIKEVPREAVSVHTSRLARDSG